MFDNSDYSKSCNDKKKKKVDCKDCAFLSLNLGGFDAQGKKMRVSEFPYKCTCKNIGRHYTSKVWCKSYKSKNHNSITAQRGDSRNE